MSTSILTGWSRSTSRRAAGAGAVALVVALSSCLGPTSGEAAPAPSGSAGIPAKAFTDYTGVTAHTVTVANISTQSAGLFAGAAVGAQAYADYVNASGGVHGRRLVVQSFDDRFTGTANKQLTEAAVQNDFATVGGFSLEDGFGGTVLRANPGMPDISESLDPATAALPNSFSPSPLAAGWPMGPLAYFKKRFPNAVLRTATITADLPSTVTAWNHEKATMVHLGYHVLYDPSLPASTTDFTQNVIAMKNLGVKMLFLEQSPESYASATIKDLDQQNFHPILVLGAPPYSESLVADSGGPAAGERHLSRAGGRPLSGGGCGGHPLGTHLPELGSEGLPGIPHRRVHLVRMALGIVVHPGAPVSRQPPQPRVAARGAAPDNHLHREQPDPGQQPGEEGADQLLSDRPDRARHVPAPGRPADCRAHPRLPVRPALLLPEVRLLFSGHGVVVVAPRHIRSGWCRCPRSRIRGTGRAGGTGEVVAPHRRRREYR